MDQNSNQSYTSYTDSSKWTPASQAPSSGPSRSVFQTWNTYQQGAAVGTGVPMKMKQPSTQSSGSIAPPSSWGAPPPVPQRHSIASLSGSDLDRFSDETLSNLKKANKAWDEANIKGDSSVKDALLPKQERTG
nr:uncharacterized protein CI109_004785 [Kwoniella shandongensis]KAA5526785.1 hypothetical protein CI109_004785 [Kwoniella shandongensis]